MPIYLTKQILTVTESRILLVNRIQICASVLERAREGKAANTAHYFDKDGSLLAKYRKIHLFSLFHEDKHVHAGNKVSVFDTEFGRTALAICYDLRFPEIFRKNSKLGAILQILPAAFPHPRLHQWKVMIQSRAIENQCYFVGVNQTGIEEHGSDVGESHYFGHSLIADPSGNIIAECGEEEELTVLDVDPELPKRVREKCLRLKTAGMKSFYDPALI